jgi:hypothetical protein
MMTLMKILQALLAFTVMVIGTQVQALIITPDDCSINSGSIPCVVDTTPGGNITKADLLAAFEILDLTGMQELYKKEVDEGIEEGSLLSSYETTFSNTATDPADGLIEYVSGNFIDCSTGCAALVKDGNQLPGWYLYDLTGLWDGKEDLSFENFWPNRGAISHISLYGDGTIVPEPGPLVLLSMGLLGLALSRRNKAC